MNVLITGASRGIGFGLTTRALAQGDTVIAVTRKADKMKSLQADYQKNLIVLEADISQLSSLKTISSKVSELGTLDLLINNAGILKPGETFEDLSESFQVNATMPFLLTKTLLPFVKKSKSPKVAQISTKMSSIDDNSSGGSQAYRASKIALNMLTRGLMIENRDVSFALIHPGWVKTDMGGSSAPVEIVDSAKGIWKVIEAMNPKSSGQFIDFKGNEIAW